MRVRRFVGMMFALPIPNRPNRRFPFVVGAVLVYPPLRRLHLGISTWSRTKCVRRVQTPQEGVEVV